MKKPNFLIKITLVMTLSLFFCLQAKSQLNYADSLQMQFDSLDSKYFPSGILHNTSPYYWDCFLWDSLSQTYYYNNYYLPNPYLYSEDTIEMSYKTFFDLYFDLYLSSVRNWAIIHPNEYKTNDSIARLTANFPISIMRMNFNELDKSAVGTGKLWFDTLINQYTLMPDTIWPHDSLNYPDSVFHIVDNPDSLAYLAFKNHWLHGANTTNPIIYAKWNSRHKNLDTNFWKYTYNANFSLPNGLFLTNERDSLTSVMIDYDDGNGYVKQYFDTDTSITYTEYIYLDSNDRPIDEIPKLFDKSIKLRLPPINGDDSLILKFNVKIIINNHLADTVFKTDSLDFINCIVEDNGFSPSTASVSIRYANSNYRHLTKPIIISGGFESEPGDYGALKYDGIMTGYIYNSNKKRIMLRLSEMPLLMDSLNDRGYDIIFIDQKDPRDYIQNAGLTVIQVIQWVNSELDANNSYEKPIVLGASMGGLIVRYALRMMELQGCCHNTRLYAAFDSPHNGANISISSQYFVKDLRDFSETLIPNRKWFGLRQEIKEMLDPIKFSYDKVLNSPAARQMLIYHKEADAVNDFNSFYNFMDSIGQPQNCRRISIVNGSERALPNIINNIDKKLISLKKYSLAPLTYLNYPNPVFNWIVIPTPRIITDFTAYSESKSVIYEYNDAVLASRSHGEAWKKQYLLSSIGMSITDLIGASNPYLAVPMQITKAAIKVNAAINFSNLNYKGTALFQVSNANYPNSYTEAPGSISKTFQEIADAANKHDISELTDGKIDSLKLSIIKSHTPSHSFMPTATTLDMKENNLMLNIKNAYLADQSITPFNCYWAPGRTEGASEKPNMLHVEVNAQNRKWILEQLDNDWELRNGLGEYKGVLMDYYNYGHPYLNDIDIIYANKPHQTILYSLDIKNDGQLYVNKQDKISLSNGVLYPRESSSFVVNTSSEPCDSTIVKIKDGGKFTIGDENNGVLNKGIVYFRENSSLEIFGNGQLLINDSSKLIIEEGATLIIHNNANIVLNGPNAVLEIRGKIVIKDNSALNPQGDGFIRFAAKMNSSNINDYWQVGNDSYLILANYSANKSKKAEIIENLFLPDNLNQVYNSAVIEIDSMVSLHSYGSIQAQNSIFTAIDSTKFYYAVKIYGQDNIRFGSCEFKYGNYGLYAQMSYGGSTFTLDTCSFTKNYIGLFTEDEYIFLRSCSFNKNLDYGWKAENMQANCDVSDCEFEYNGFAGAYFSGQSNVELNVNNSNFRYNYQHGIELSEVNFSSLCSRYSNNGQSGIYAQSNASVDISENKKNRINGNYTGILLNKALLLNIEHGFNNFSSNQFFIVGELKPDNYYQGLSTATPLRLIDNLLPAPSAQQMPINIYLIDPTYGNQITIPLDDWTQNVSFSSTVCFSEYIPDNYNNYKAFDGKISISPINTPHFQNTYLIDAFRLAAMQMSYGDEYVGNDTLAISWFKEIFDNIPANVNEDEMHAIDDALNLMFSALTYAIEHELIDPNRALDGMPVDEYVNMIADELQNRLDDLDYANMYYEEQYAYYQLMLAQMYRAAEHYDYALEILQNDNFFFNTTLKSQADYWACVCMAEDLLLKDLIERSEYDEKIDSCHEISTANKSLFIPQYGISEVSVYKQENQIIDIYPNPTDQLLAIEFKLRVEDAQVEIRDISGKLIWKSDKSVKGKQLRLKLPKISNGTYMLKTITNNQVFINKIIIK